MWQSMKRLRLEVVESDHDTISCFSVVSTPISSPLATPPKKARSPLRRDVPWYSAVQRQGKRRDLQDMCKIDLDSPFGPFFGVFDGHGKDGLEFASFAAKRFPELIQKNLEALDLKEAIRVSFPQLDQEMCSEHSLLSKKLGGTTALVAVVSVDSNQIVVGHVGDCRAVASRSDPLQLVEITRDHVVNNEEERERIEYAGGFVIQLGGCWRVSGELALSRSLGDLQYKSSGLLTAEADVWSCQLKDESGDRTYDYLILGSDGFFKNITEDSIQKILSRNQNASHAASRLLSLTRGSSDDVSVVVINLKDLKQT